MYKGKRTASKGGAGRRKTTVVLIAVLAALALTVGSTVAYIIAQSEQLINIFTPTEVKCEVIADGTTFTAKNTGTADAYLRAAVVANWVDTSGNIHWQQPGFEVSGTGWQSGDDGFYYYMEPVASGASAGALQVEPAADAQNPDNTIYTFTVQVLGEAIQSEPADAVATAWPGRPAASGS